MSQRNLRLEPRMPGETNGSIIGECDRCQMFNIRIVFNILYTICLFENFISSFCRDDANAKLVSIFTSVKFDLFSCSVSVLDKVCLTYLHYALSHMKSELGLNGILVKGYIEKSSLQKSSSSIYSV